MTAEPSFKRTQALQIYLKEGVTDDDLLLKVWNASKKHARPQDIFRSMLMAGLMSLLETGQIPEEIIEDCNLDILIEKKIRRKRRVESAKNIGQGAAAEMPAYGPFVAPYPIPQMPVPMQPYPGQNGQYPHHPGYQQNADTRRDPAESTRNLEKTDEAFRELSVRRPVEEQKTDKKIEKTNAPVKMQDTINKDGKDGAKDPKKRPSFANLM